MISYNKFGRKVMPPRVVADTNFWVAAAGWSGMAHRLYLALVAGKFVHLTSFAILNEISRVLRRLPDFTEQMVYEWYCEIGTHSELVLSQPVTEKRIRLCRDPDDDKLLECAVWGRATYLITRDQDLLTLNGYRGIRIIQPQQLWAVIE
jgi:putative PIN family toxin of toxin-antitoxin system